MKAKWTGGRVPNGIAAIILALATASPLAHAARADRAVNQDVNGQDRLLLRKQVRQGDQGVERSDALARQREQRLSPEERQQLRRDIREAGQEIYLRRR